MLFTQTKTGHIVLIMVGLLLICYRFPSKRRCLIRYGWFFDFRRYLGQAQMLQHMEWRG